MKTQHIVPIAGLLGLSAAALAGPIKEPHFDVLLQNVGGSLATAAIGEDEDPASIVPGIRVFGAEMGEAPFGPGQADEPGFQGFGFTTGTPFTFDIRSALGQWNGGSFDTSSSTITVAVSLSDPFLPNVTSGTGFVPGFQFATADGAGDLHQHLELGINSPVLGVPVGIYLLELQVSSPGMGTTLPFWFVLNNGDTEEAHEAAIAYVEDNLVPTPGAAALLAFAGIAGVRRRRL